MSEYERREGFFQSADHLNLFYRFYHKPNAQNTVVILHGHGEHSGRYQKFAEILKDKNVNIAMYDFRGHGRSDGFHVYVDDYSQFVQDLDTFINYLKAQGWIQGKVTLIAHSNGALTAAHWLDQNKNQVKGVILSSPFFGHRLSWPLILLNKCIGFFNPKFTYTNPIYPPYLTHNETERDHYKRDSYVRRKITARLLSQMILYIQRLDEKERIVWPFPVYVLMSGDERVVDPGKTKAFYEKLEVPEKDLVSYKDMYHEIFNEAEQKKVFDQLKIFLDTILA